MKTAHSNMDRNQLAAVRHVVIISLRRSFPHYSANDIARSLGLHHSAVTYHLSSRYKGLRLEDAPTWARPLTNACNLIACGSLDLAADQLRAAASGIDAVQRKEAA